jgi:hypothetical protein
MDEIAIKNLTGNAQHLVYAWSASLEGKSFASNASAGSRQSGIGGGSGIGLW